MSSQTLSARGASRSPSAGPDVGSTASVLKLGAVVSVSQSALFVVIRVAGLVLGTGHLVDHGFASLAFANPAAFRVVKAASFWLAFIAFLTGQKLMIVLGLGAVTFVTGPLWHLWIPRLFLRSARERGHAR